MQDIGPIVAESIVEYFKNENNKQIINQLFSYGIEIENAGISNSEENYFTNKSVVLTGTLQNYKREELTEILYNLGANVNSSVSKKTDIVIAGENAGSKLAKANEFKIKVMSEDELIKLLENIKV